ncbi:hypothetical protein F2Q69_00048005 [Brassica cretica]|uniref:Uncharacterized protein n=1 Tax=Brassica cretica TaxID=69181 RepID=A0A8S9PK92_BRACR|nr:hypothetical protein F2Q69_00048005 [Brassica cretica]
MGGCAADCPDPADITLSMAEESTPISWSCSPYPRWRPAANNADFAKTKPTTVCSQFTQMSRRDADLNLTQTSTFNPINRNYQARET